MSRALEAAIAAVVAHVSGGAGICTARQFDALMDDVRALAQVRLLEKSAAVPQPKLIGMTIAEARAAKWLAGREKHGPVFVGDPLEELDGELLDAMNYCEEAAARGADLGSMPEELRGLCLRVRQIYQRSQYEQLLDSEAGDVG